MLAISITKISYRNNNRQILTPEAKYSKGHKRNNAKPELSVYEDNWRKQFENIDT